MVQSLLKQVAVVSESPSIDPGDLARVSAALQKQATRDLAQFWQLAATVDSFPRLEDVPAGYWPIIIMDDIHTSGAAGVHEDENGQPFALVTASRDRDVWSLTCSHELIEMLIDPFGNRMVPSDSPKPDQGRVQILVEACDPSEDAQFAYTVNGILVSDFYTTRYFDPVASAGVRYSLTGAIREPRQVLPGGYLSWVDPSTGVWWQEIWFGGNQPSFRELGKLDARNGSFRGQIDRLTGEETRQALERGRAAAQVAGLAQGKIVTASEGRAKQLRKQINALVSYQQQGVSSQGGEAEASASRRRRNGSSAVRRAPSFESGLN